MSAPPSDLHEQPRTTRTAATRARRRRPRLHRRRRRLGRRRRRDRPHRERADRRQHGSAAPVDPRRAAARARARGRDGHAGPARSSATCTPASRRTCEYRNWTQAVTFITRCDYLAPLFNEADLLPGRRAAARHRGPDPRAGRRCSACWCMELQRISSHLVWLATGGMELGAHAPRCCYGFREREQIARILEMITGLRMNHAYIRPGGVAQDLPPGAVDAIREFVPVHARQDRRVRGPALGQPDLARAAARASATSTPRPACSSASPARCCAPRAWPGTCARRCRTCGYETYDFDVVTETDGDCYARYMVRINEMRESLRIIEQALDRLRARPDDGRGQEDRLAGAARARRRRPRQLPRPHPQDHGHVDGGADPPLQAGHRGLPGAGRSGLRADRVAARRARRARRLRRRHPAVPRAPARPKLRQPAGGPGDRARAA